MNRLIILTYWQVAALVAVSGYLGARFVLWMMVQGIKGRLSPAEARDLIRKLKR